MQKVILASGNQGKLRELQKLLSDKAVEFIPQTRFDIPDAVEDGLSFVENAIIKARHASKLTGLPAIADDSGLEVDALAGEPGIYSARYAGTNGNRDSNDMANNAKLLHKLQDVPEQQRTARFQCVIALLRHAHDPMPLICQGTWEGRILFEPRGSNGFGYDPLFYVPTHHCASAELPAEEKNQLSHRGQALRQLLQR
ncbi:MAG: RdgB/HAM1 family non-canonical purine NTP pyrophosphatase, partial [Pseudohongiellaceae bacterium]